MNDKPILMVCDNTVYVKIQRCISELMAELTKVSPIKVQRFIIFLISTMLISVKGNWGIGTIYTGSETEEEKTKGKRSMKQFGIMVGLDKPASFEGWFCKIDDRKRI